MVWTRNWGQDDIYSPCVVNATKDSSHFNFPCQSMISTQLHGLTRYNFPNPNLHVISPSLLLSAWITPPAWRCWWLLRGSLFIIFTQVLFVFALCLYITRALGCYMRFRSFSFLYFTLESKCFVGYPPTPLIPSELITNKEDECME